jgi:thiamine-phosphate pyrophosphorylase
MMAAASVDQVGDMDNRLIAWARAVKSRRALLSRQPALPVLWLFTDAMRLADPRAAIERLPKGLCGVVLRQLPDAEAAELAALCRARRLEVAVAGDARLAWRLRAGVHLRRGDRSGRAGSQAPFALRFATSSAHSLVELRRAWRAGASLVFLSPCFATASHPGQVPLGPLRWHALARAGGGAVAALGGLDGRNARALSWRWCAGAAAIGALV